MLRPLALCLLLAAPAVGAQAFVRADSAAFGEVVRVVPPASFQTLGLLDDYGELEGYALAARGGDGHLAVVAHELPRQPSVGGGADGAWRSASVGCGTACFLAWYADPVTGAVSPAIGSPLYEDEAAGWVLTPSAGGVVLVDPFDPTWAWELAIPTDSPLSAAVANLIVDVEVTPGGTLTISADGIPGVVRARVPERD